LFRIKNQAGLRDPDSASMPTFGRYTHAIVSRVPDSFQNLPTIDGTCIDLDKARIQQDALVRCLRSLHVDVLELPPDEESPNSVFPSDCAVIHQGVALICRPLTTTNNNISNNNHRGNDVATIRAVLRKELDLDVVELTSPKAFINASDVLFTGKEFFVGVGVETNTDGALQLANTWPEYPTTPVKLEGLRRLRDRITMAGIDVLSVSSAEKSQLLMKRIEREASHRYKVLTLPEEDAANCLFVNGTLIHIDSCEAAESYKLFEDRVDYPQISLSLSEFHKTGRGLSSICLLVRKFQNIRTL
jgi:dimethylargininase